MNLLLDTHILLWWLADDKQLSSDARELIQSTEHAKFISTATLWEIRIKEMIGKLTINADLAATMLDLPFEHLPIMPEHALSLIELPNLHRDPFDRMLISQCLCEKLVLLTHDKRLADYPISCVLV